MSNTQGIISIPVVNNPSGGDIQTVLGSSAGDVATLCKLSNINRWARYKPVSHSTKKAITQSERNSVHWGLSVPFFTGEINEQVYGIMQAPDGYYWGYIKPSGGTNSPYRQSDFGKTPNDSTALPWVGSGLTGYNHSAKFPMEVVIDTAGVIYSNGVYQINANTLSKLKFYFQNPTGDDLCIQDFINWGIETSSQKWRPFFYMYADDDWYTSGKTPTRYGGGTVFSYTRTDVPTLEVSVANLNLNQYYHICIGIGCCDANASTWVTGSNYKFIAPFNNKYQQQQFYYKILVGSYFDRAITVTTLKYVNSQGAWTNAEGSYQRFTTPSDITDVFAFTATITKTSTKVYFVPPTSTSPTPTLKIRVLEAIGSSSTERTVAPTSSSNPGTNPNPNYIEIAAGSTTETVTIYGRFTNGLGRNQTATYRIQARINDSGNWLDAGSFSVSRP